MPLPLATVFADVPDPRRDTENKLHLLANILTIATCAIIAGADGWEPIAECGESKRAFFGRFLELPNGIPSHDTFGRVFAKLDPDAFADRFGRGMAARVRPPGGSGGHRREVGAPIGERHVHRVPALMLYAFRSDTSSQVRKLWCIQGVNFSRCFVGKPVPRRWWPY